MRLYIDLPDPSGVFEIQVVMDASKTVETSGPGEVETGVHVTDAWVRYKLVSESDWSTLPEGKLSNKLTTQALAMDLKKVFQQALDDAIIKHTDSRMEKV